MSGLNDDLDRACADGRISQHDVDEVRHFADFLDAAATKGGPRAWREFYPEDYARAVAERDARIAREDTT